MAKNSSNLANPTVSPTLQSIAERVGVSRVTVGHVLLGTGTGNIRVAEKTSNRIRKAAKQMGYQPNRMAQQLAGRASNVIGVVIDSRSPAVFFSRLSAIEQFASVSGYRLMVGQTHNDLGQLREYCNDFASRGIDGVICITHRYPDFGEQVADIFAKLKNVVFIGQPASERTDLNIVAVDTVSGIRQAVEHLTSNNRKRIGLQLFTSGSYAMEQRRQGYCEGLKNSKIKIDERLIVDIGPSGSMSPTASSAVSQSVDTLIDEHHVDAIISTNDIVAVHTIKCLKSRGLRVPEDVAVIGHDNTDITNMYEPSITSIDQQTDVVTLTAMKLLIKLIANKTLTAQERHTIIDPQLVTRESS